MEIGWGAPGGERSLRSAAPGLPLFLVHRAFFFALHSLCSPDSLDNRSPLRFVRAVQ